MSGSLDGWRLVEAPRPDADPATRAPLSAERFRAEGRAIVDWIADYWSAVESLPVMPRVEPGWVRSRLPAAAPEHPEDLAAVLADLDHVVLPGLAHWQHPAFFGWFPAGVSGPSVLGEMLAAGLGVQGMLWATSPACTELETHVLDWLRELLGLPERYASSGAGGSTGGGVILDSASSGTLCALVAARERLTRRAEAVTDRAAARPLVAYASSEAHSSVEKAVRIAGLGSAALRRISVDDRDRMDASALARAMDADVAAGCLPCFVVATVGTTASGGIDPVPDIAAAARRHGAWLHVDAAWAGAAAICPEWRRSIVAGADSADSWGFNPHKWLLVNLDCHALWVADSNLLVQALSVTPEYLRNAASDRGAVIDYRDWQVPLGRRFRALKLWLTIRMLGAESLRRHIRDHVAWAAEFAAWVRADARFRLLREPVLGLVCFAVAAGDEASRRLLESVNAEGSACLSHARIDGRYAIRVAVGGAQTQRRHVAELWHRLTALLDPGS